MNSEAMTIRNLLDQELDRRSFASGMKLEVEELFEKEKAMKWIGKLIGQTHADYLKTLMAQTSAVRLGHAAATYLLGVAVRDRLQIPFDLLPRFITSGSCDGFQFFWALICLCHDLGYHFEHASKNNRSETEKMNSPVDRKELFHIQYDLLELDENELREICSILGPEYYQWISEARENIRGYDGYRRKRIHDPESTTWICIDHGIAGAILLYDLLRKEYDRMVEEIQSGIEGAAALGIKATKKMGVMDSVSDMDSAKRFLACGLWIACTVGRHNMWVAENPEADRIYDCYNLTKLRYNQESSLVRADSSLEQMLFLLDFLDTIDPVKGIYLRACETAEEQNQQEKRKDELILRRGLLLDHTKIRFVGDYTSEKGIKCHWGNALTYRKIELFMDPVDEADTDKLQKQKDYFAGFMGSTQNLHTWLRTKAPLIDKANCTATYFVPAHRSKGNIWPYGITDDEVDALLLYEGCGVPGKYGEFYSPAEAYQTFNLLMMPGTAGEEVRVLKEGQYPRSIYITEWAKTLDVILDIFTAQCKYAYGVDREGKSIREGLFRCDRLVNVELMNQEGGTFALTSTSLEDFKVRFLENKEDPRILRITLGEKVPYFDYMGFFGDKYAFSTEREVLLPPLLKMEIQEGPAKCVKGKGPYGSYIVHFDGFDMDRAEQQNVDEYDLIALLEANAEAAAESLKKMKKYLALPDEDDPYWKWKAAFQKLTLRCMGNIYKRYFRTN